MKKNTSGFTLIELLVVIIIMVILTAIGITIYSRFQMQGRDNKRKADVAVIMSKLESYFDKNGRYPPSCLPSEYDEATNTCPATPTRVAVGGPPINQATTNAQLRTMFGEFPDTIKDPMGTTDNSSLDSGLSFGITPSSSYLFPRSYGYLYKGGYVIPTNGGTTNSSTGIGIHGIRCSYTIYLASTPASGDASAAFVAYYSEADDTIYFRITSRGSGVSLSKTASGINMPDKCKVASN